MARLGSYIFIKTPDGKTSTSHSLNILDYDPDKIADLHLEQGCGAAYAPYVPIENGQMLTAVSSAFNKRGIILAEMGYWNNLLDLDPEIRRDNRREMANRLASADEMGVLCTVNTIGSYTNGTVNDGFNPKSLSDEALEDAIDFAEELLKEVNPKRTCLAYELFAFTALDSIDALKKLTSRIKHPKFKVHMDLSNLVTSVRSYFEYENMLNDCVKCFGNRIVSCHVKDLSLVPGTSVYIRECAIGTGGLPIGRYIKLMDEISQDMPLMLEHLDSPDDYILAQNNLKKIAQSENVVLRA